MRGRFYPRQPPGADGFLDVGDAALGHRLQGAKPLHQEPEGPGGVDVRGVLGQDGEDHFVDGVQAGIFFERPVLGRQRPDGLSDVNARPGGLLA